MFFVAKGSWLAFLALTMLLFGGCASTPSHDTAALPVPPQIEDNVAFWRLVYGEWSRSQVAFHDDEHLGVIYEVARLPGEIRGGYTAEQARFVRAKEAEYRARLASMERKLASGDRLTSTERHLHDQLVAKGGRLALSGAAGRLRVQRGVRERFRRGLEISGRYDQAFRAVFRTRGLPEDLAFLPHVESSFQTNARSSVGAAGVWQFMPATGRVYDLTVNRTLDERLDPVLAAAGAARYLDDAYRKLGSWPLAITSYNHGQGGMAKAKAQYGDDLGRIVRHYDGPYFGFASRNFYAEFMAARAVASQPARYFPEGVAYERPLDYDQLVLRTAVPIHHLARHYGLPAQRLENLNLAWRTPITRNGAAIPAGSTVWLPAGTMARVATQPGPLPARVVKAEPKPEPRLAQATPKPVSRSTPTPNSAPKPALAQATRKKEAAPQTHVVQPNETLYRVALRYDLSVAELRRLNRMKPDEETIRTGQKLRVSG